MSTQYEMDGCNTSLTSDALLDISNQPTDQRIAFVGHPYGDKGSILAASLKWHDQRRQAHICKLNCPASECGEKPEVHGCSMNCVSTGPEFWTTFTISGAGVFISATHRQDKQRTAGSVIPHSPQDVQIDSVFP